MDKLHRLASGEGDNDIENGLGGDERLVLGDFARATAVVAKEGLREGLSHGKELDMQQVRLSLYSLYSLYSRYGQDG